MPSVLLDNISFNQLINSACTSQIPKMFRIQTQESHQPYPHGHLSPMHLLLPHHLYTWILQHFFCFHSLSIQKFLGFCLTPIGHQKFLLKGPFSEAYDEKTLAEKRQNSVQMVSERKRMEKYMLKQVFLLINIFLFLSITGVE